MDTLLLIERQGEPYLIPRRATAGSRIRARVWNWPLDGALAEGRSPDSSEALSLRAQALISWKSRRRLSRAIRGLVRDAQRPRHPFDGCLPICRCGIRASRSLLEEMADRLEAPGAIDARGAAQLCLLLKDGLGPLYDTFQSEKLIRALEAASEALEPDP